MAEGVKKQVATVYDALRGVNRITFNNDVIYDRGSVICSTRVLYIDRNSKDSGFVLSNYWTFSGGDQYGLVREGGDFCDEYFNTKIAGALKDCCATMVKRQVCLNSFNTTVYVTVREAIPSSETGMILNIFFLVNEKVVSICRDLRDCYKLEVSINSDITLGDLIVEAAKNNFKPVVPQKDIDMSSSKVGDSSVPSPDTFNKESSSESDIVGKGQQPDLDSAEKKLEGEVSVGGPVGNR